MDSGMWDEKRHIHRQFALLSGAGASGRPSGNRATPTPSALELAHAILHLCKTFYVEEDLSFRTVPQVVGWPPEPSTTMVFASDRDWDKFPRLLRQTTLYSERVIVILPCAVEESQGFSSAHLSSNEVAQIGELSRRYSELTFAGRCLFLPSSYTKFYQSRCGEDHRVLTPSGVLNGANGGRLGLSRQPITPGTEPYFIFKTLLLPYFPAMDLITVARIAQDETDAFTRFNYFLRTRLTQIAHAESDMELRDLFDEIEDGVAELRIDAEKLSRRRLNAAKVSLFGLSLSSSIVTSGGALAVATGVLGSVTLLDLLKDYADRRNAQLELKKSRFYIPYLLLKDEDSR